MAPCVSVLPLHELQHSLSLLNERLRPYNLSLDEYAPKHNSLYTHRCSEGQRSSGKCQACPKERMAMLLDPGDHAVRDAIRMQTTSEPVVRVSHRLWDWFNRSHESLLRRRAVPCASLLSKWSPAGREET